MVDQHLDSPTRIRAQVREQLTDPFEDGYLIAALYEIEDEEPEPSSTSSPGKCKRNRNSSNPLI